MRGRDFSRYFKRFLNLTARRVVLVDEDKESRVIGRLNDLFRNLLAPVGQIVNGDLANPFWRFFGRRQKKPIDDASAIVRGIYGRDIGDAMFSLSEGEDGLDVALVSSGLAGLDEAVADGLAATFLDHALGEEAVMRRISRVRGIVPGRESQPLMSLSELATRISAS